MHLQMYLEPLGLNSDEYAKLTIFVAIQYLMVTQGGNYHWQSVLGVSWCCQSTLAGASVGFVRYTKLWVQAISKVLQVNFWFSFCANLYVSGAYSAYLLLCTKDFCQRFTVFVGERFNSSCTIFCIFGLKILRFCGIQEYGRTLNDLPSPNKLLDQTF